MIFPLCTLPTLYTYGTYVTPMAPQWHPDGTDKTVVFSGIPTNWLDVEC